MILRCVFLSVVFVLVSIGNRAQAQNSSVNQFVLNKGQVRFAGAAKADKVLCTLAFPSGYAHFLNEGIDYYFIKNDQDDSLNQLVERISLRYQDVSKRAQFEVGKYSGYQEHFYQGAQTENAIHTKGILDFWIREIYAGIDLHYYWKDGALKYDFVVAQGAKINQIKWTYAGRQSSTIQNGSIHIKGEWGEIIETKPYSFTTKNNEVLDIEYAGNSTYSFNSSETSFKEELIIDPAVLWSTYYGGSGNETASSITYHSDGGFFGTGITTSSTNIAYNGYISNLTNQSGFFVTKFDSVGTIEWASYYFSSNTLSGGGATYDSSGCLYLVGASKDSTLATRGNRKPSGHIDDHDAFIMKVRWDGIPCWSKFFGGDSLDRFSVVRTINSTEIIASGHTRSNVADVNSLGINTLISYDPFITKMDSAGNVIWSRIFTVDNTTLITDFQILPNNKLILSLLSKSENLATNGAFMTNRPNKGQSINDCMLMKISSIGSIEWATYFGGNGDEGDMNLELGTHGEVYCAGFTYSGNGYDYPPGNSSYHGSQDGILMKWDTSGNLIWSKYYGSNGSDIFWTFKMNEKGDLVIAGSGAGPAFIQNGALQDTLGSLIDGFVLKLDTAGQVIWGSYFGTAFTEWPDRIDVRENEFIIAGHTNGGTYFSKSNHQKTFGGGTRDIFIIRIVENQIVLHANTSVAYCPGSSFKIPIEILDSVGYNNQIVIQLVDSSGTYTTLIGSKVSNQLVRDSIPCTIPSNMAAGSYRVKYTSTAPAQTFWLESELRINHSPSRNFVRQLSPKYCSTDSVLLESDNPAEFNFTWYKDGAIFNTDTNSVLLDTSGTYWVKISESNGCIRESSHVSILFEYPRAAVDWNKDSLQCRNTFVLNVQDNSDTIYSYTRNWLWNGTVVDTALNYVQSSADTGNGVLTLRIETANGCSDSTVLHFTVFPEPIPSWTISDTIFCLNNQFLSIKRNQDSSWDSAQIYFGDGVSSPAINAVHSYQYSGAFDMVYKVIDAHGCQDSIIQVMLIHPSPAAEFVLYDSILCDRKSPVQFLNKSTGFTQSSWDFGDSSFSQIQDPNKAYQVGTYLVSLVASNMDNCSDTFRKQLTIHQTESAQVTPASAQFCAGDSVQVQVNCTNAQGLFWMMNNQLLDTACTIWVKDSMERTLIRLGSNYCPDTLQLKYGLFPQVAVPQVTRTNDTLRSSGSYFGYQWFKDGQMITGATGNELVITQNGTYKLDVNDSNGCKSPSSSMQIQNVGFEEIHMGSIHVYPNPASHSFDIVWEATENQIHQFYVYNPLGQEVYHLASPEGNGLQVDVTNWNDGVYTICIMTRSGEMFSQMVVVQHGCK